MDPESALIRRVPSPEHSPNRRRLRIERSQDVGPAQREVIFRRIELEHKKENKKATAAIWEHTVQRKLCEDMFLLDTVNVLVV